MLGSFLARPHRVLLGYSGLIAIFKGLTKGISHLWGST